MAYLHTLDEAVHQEGVLRERLVQDLEGREGTADVRTDSP